MENLRLITSVDELDGTCFFEFLPGRYESHRIWNKESVYLDEEVMSLVEPSIEKFLPEYNHYGFLDIHKDSWTPIISELNNLSTELKKRNKDVIRRMCSFCFVSTEENFFRSFEDNVQKLDELIRNLTLWILDTLKKENHIAILGI